MKKTNGFVFAQHRYGQVVVNDGKISYRGIEVPYIMQSNGRFFCECEIDGQKICCNARTREGLADQFAECIDELYEEILERAYENLRRQAPVEDYDPADDLPFV